MHKCIVGIVGGGWVRQRCYVACVTRASSWYWLTVGQGLLSLQQVRIEGDCFYFFCFFTAIHFHFSPVPSLSCPLLYLLSLFSLSLGDDTKWPTKADVLLNPSTVNQNRHHWEHSHTITCKVIKILYLSVLNYDGTVVHQMNIFWAYSHLYIIIMDILVKRLADLIGPLLRKSTFFTLLYEVGFLPFPSHPSPQLWY